MDETQFPTKNSTPNKKLTCEMLNGILADSLDLVTQTKHAHWNVKGPHFIALHDLFDKLVDMFDEPIDDIAERIVQLGGIAEGTIRNVATVSRIKEFPGKTFAGLTVVEALVDRYAALAKTTRDAIDSAAGAQDADTADILTGYSRDLDKALWFLEAHLQG
ncbi:MAG: DNA starvation/stationary phase protection protein Dps [Fimbriiglobus sp.]